MKKLLWTILACFLLVAAVFGTAACGGNNEEVINPDKTQLFIGAYNGGYGDEWMKDLKKRFEEKYAERSFEPNKKGVQVQINTSGTTYVGENILNNINNLNTEVIFTQERNYNSFAGTGKVLEITDLVTDSLKKEFGEDADIKSKLAPEVEEFLKVDGKYYGLPHLEAFYGFHYNVDLFEEKMWYFSANPNNGNDGFIKTLNEKRSAGPNGVYDYDPADPDAVTDDGLPATYEEFYKLCNRIKATNEFTPITWAGNAVQYMNLAATGFLYDELGKNNSQLMFGTEGTATGIVENGDLNNVRDIPITYETGYKTFQYKGLYNVLKFFEKINDEGWYVKDSRTGDNKNLDNQYTHLRAQSDFILANIANNTDKPAMIAEGSYWESEAKKAFEVLETYGSGKYQARYGFLPYPKSSADKLGKNILEGNIGYCYINGNIKEEKKEVAKLFLQFAYTNESLAEFTKITGATKGVSYTLSDEQYDALSYWEKTVWKCRENSEMVYGFSTSPLYIGQSNRFRHYLNLTSSKDGNTYDNIMKAFDAGLSAEEVFFSIGEKKNAAWWNQNFGSIIDSVRGNK